MSSKVALAMGYAQAIQEKKSLTKALLDTVVSLKNDIDTYASEHKWAEYAKSGLEWLLKGVGYGVAVGAVSTTAAKFGTVVAIATAGGLVISGEATAEIINRGGEQLVDYAVSFADTPEEAAGYADVVISGLETIVTVAGAVGGYKAGKAISGKLANLKARVPAKVGEAFKGKIATKANLQTAMKVEIKAVADKTTVVKAETAAVSQTANSVCQKNVRKNVFEKEASDAINKAPYEPKKAQNLATKLLDSKKITSSTVPRQSMPNVKLAGQCKERTIIINPETQETAVQRVVFDQRGFLIFDPYVKVETRISGDLANMTSDAHMRAATRQLKLDIESGRVNKNIFNNAQLNCINNEARKIPGFTWHHHQETGRMQLVQEDIHEWIKHIGGNALWGLQ